MTRKPGPSIKAFVIELGIYAALVAVYFTLVLHFLGGWLHGLFESDKHLYGFIALGLIVAQGVLLDVLTSWLLRMVRRKVR